LALFTVRDEKIGIRILTPEGNELHLKVSGRATVYKIVNVA
jgi:hypothetical protein